MNIEDVFGVKPIANAMELSVAKSIEGVESFLKRVCAPALDELGLMAKDQFRYWRLQNILRILEKAKGKLEFSNGQLEICAHPRVALSIIENGSMNDDDEIQELWAGLFASSCSGNGRDDQNLIFVDLLKKITVVEARILKYACENAKVFSHKNGLFSCEFAGVSIDKLIDISKTDDIHRLDRELDHLRSLELIGGPFGGGFLVDSDNLDALITPTTLALNLFARAYGNSNSISEYWKGRIADYRGVNGMSESFR